MISTVIDTKNGAIRLDESSYSTLINMGYPELEAKEMVESAIKNTQNDFVIEQRLQAYKREADPLYIEAQFDGTQEAMQKWRDKIAEIKARYPKPMAQPAA